MTCPKEIVLLEANSNYTLLHKRDGSYEISSYHLAWHLKQLEDEIVFLRPNRKYGVNLSVFKTFEGDILWLKRPNIQIKVSRRRKEKIQDQIETYLKR